MTYADEQTLIEAMSVHFGQPKQSIRALASNGNLYPQWRDVVNEFYRANPDWTPEGWRTRVAAPYIPSDVGSLKPPHERWTEDQKWLFWGFVALAFVVFVLLVLF